MCSSYLDLPLRSLREVAEEVAVEIAMLETKCQQLVDDEVIAATMLDFARSDDLMDQAYAISHQLAALADRLDDLDDEIAWREQPKFNGGMAP